MRKSYFKPSEFLSPQIADSKKLLEINFNNLSWKSKVDILNKIHVWIDALHPIRAACGFPIVVTDGVRLHGRVTSQHRYFGAGAVDIRPSVRGGSYTDRLQTLKAHIAYSDGYTRVCYYPKGNNFPNGGLHKDRKSITQGGKQFFINQGPGINWKLVSKDEFLEAV